MKTHRHFRGKIDDVVIGDTAASDLHSESMNRCQMCIRFVVPILSVGRTIIIFLDIFQVKWFALLLLLFIEQHSKEDDANAETLNECII